jgi:threonine synthase
MDIMISSNFERMLFELYDNDGAAIAKLMDDFRTKPIAIDDKRFARAREIFDSYAVDDQATCDTIRSVFEADGYLLDPHTAIGVKAARETVRHKQLPMIVLATAHPAKFPEAARKAGQTEDPVLPNHMQDLFKREERYSVIDKDLAAVKQFMQKELSK